MATVIAAYLAAVSCAMFLLKRRNAAEALLVASFASALLAVVWKWTYSGMVPMRSLGDVFVILGAIAWPVAAFCRRRCGLAVGLADALWAAAMLFPAYHVFLIRTTPLPAALDSVYFGPHVGACLLGYAFIFKASVGAVSFLLRHDESKLKDIAAIEKFSSLLKPASFFLTLGIVLGSMWGCDAWGNWWNWDPKEMLALTTLLMLAAAVSFGKSRPRSICAALLCSAALALMNLLWANLSKIFAGFHNYA